MNFKKGPGKGHGLHAELTNGGRLGLQRYTGKSQFRLLR